MKKKTSPRWLKNRSKSQRSILDSPGWSLGSVSPFKVREPPHPPPRCALKNAAASWLGLVLAFLVLALAWPALASHVLFWLPLGSVLRPNLAPQIHQISWKNRCQDAFPSWLPFFIDFSLIFDWFLLPTWTPSTPQNQWKSSFFLFSVLLR